MSNLNPGQFSGFESRMLQDRTSWQNANEHHVVRIVEQHAGPAPVLYRGIAVSDHRNYLDPQKVNVGDRLHLPVSSFTTDRDVAVQFAHGDENEHHGQYTPVVLRAEGAHGVNVEHLSNLPWEHEWLSRGQFEVTHKSSDPENDIDHEIHLRRVDG